MIKELKLSEGLSDLVRRGIMTLTITTDTVIPITKQLSKLHLSGVNVLNHRFTETPIDFLKHLLGKNIIFRRSNYSEGLKSLNEDSLYAEPIITPGLVEQVGEHIFEITDRVAPKYNIKYNEFPPFNVLLINTQEDKYVLITYLKD